VLLPSGLGPKLQSDPVPHQKLLILTSSLDIFCLSTLSLSTKSSESNQTIQILPSFTMAEAQPPTIVEGATTGDVDDEIPAVAKSAEDRKAAAALSSLDTPRDDESAGKDVDQEAVRKAMERLGGAGATNGAVAKKDEQKVVKKTVKVDPADVTLLVSQLKTS